VVPAKPTENKDPTEPLTFETIEDVKTGKCHSSLQTLHLFVFGDYDLSPSTHIAPGSVIKPLQEESKKEELPMEESKKDENPIEVKEKPLPTDLPVLNEVPMFKG
jgi:hypothetical protein